MAIRMAGNQGWLPVRSACHYAQSTMESAAGITSNF